jgi:hypothetical protein
MKLKSNFITILKNNSLYNKQVCNIKYSPCKYVELLFETLSL